MGVDPKRLVESGYDAMAERHLDWLRRIEGDPRMRFLADLDARLPDGSDVLDLGCGAGVPCTEALARRHTVHGVDISEEQLRLARERVPRATFEHGDMASLRFPDARWDAITAFYSIVHVPRAEHPELFARLVRWLRPGGYLLASLSANGSGDCVEEGWLGVPMFFSGHPAATNARLLHEAGLDVLVDETVEMREPEGPTTFQWVLGRAGTR